MSGFLGFCSGVCFAMGVVAILASYDIHSDADWSIAVTQLSLAVLFASLARVYAAWFPGRRS